MAASIFGSSPCTLSILQAYNAFCKSFIQNISEGRRKDNPVVMLTCLMILRQMQRMVAMPVSLRHYRG
jgi:hypothetical protein